jgi:hypothetical protein
MTAPSSSNSLELETIRTLLEPFAARGYVHAAAFWERLAARYPAVDLVLQAMAAVDWLEQPRNASRRCSRAFLANWVKRAAADAAGPVQQPARLPAIARGMVVAGTFVQAQALQGPRPEPPGLVHLAEPLRRISTTELTQALAERARVPLADKLAQIKAGRTP